MGVNYEELINDEVALEEHLKATKTAPRVTLEELQNSVDKVEYHLFPDSTFTVCRIILKNGFSVTGESACVSVANFDPELGKSLAYKTAFNKLWSFAGYHLAQYLYEESQNGG